MSNNILRILLNSLKTIYSKNNIKKINKFDKKVNLFVLSVSVGIHSMYAYSTVKTEEIKVMTKYKLVNRGFTNFMIIDNKGRHFNVNNSLWFWKWDSIEDWSSIKTQNSLFIKYYGWRIPLFGLFPNIVNSNIID